MEGLTIHSEGLTIHSDSDIDTMLNQLSEKMSLDNHPLFKDLDNLEPKKFGFIMSGFYYAVTNWMRHLDNLRNRTENSHAIELISENINDELGDADSHAHWITFLWFLQKLKYYQQPDASTASDKFNDELFKIAQEKSVAYNACVLAGIEYFYVDVSYRICQYCQKHGIEQQHYQTHEELDKKHAKDLFVVARVHDATNQEMVEGTQNGYQLLWNIFAELT